MKLFGYEITKRNTVDKLLGSYFGRLFSGKSASVSDKSILYLPTVWRCIDIISASIAGLPVNVKRERNGQVEKVLHETDRMLKRKANSYMTAHTWRELAVRDVVSKGDHVSLIAREGSRPVELLPVIYEDIQDVYVKDGRVIYEIGRGKNIYTYMDYEVFHLKGPSMDGLRGMSMVEMHRRTFSTALSSAQYIQEWYENDATPKGILTFPGKLSAEAPKNIRESWQKLYGMGGESVAILDAGAKFERVSLPPSDSLYLETAQYGDRQICNIYGIPLHMVNDLSDSHYNNIEASGIELVKFTLMAWVNRFEAELNDKLLTEAQKSDHFFDFNVDGLMRGDMKSRAEYYMKMRQMRAMSANEVRYAENMNPYEGGDKFDNPNIDTNTETNENQ